MKTSVVTVDAETKRKLKELAKRQDALISQVVAVKDFY